MANASWPQLYRNLPWWFSPLCPRFCSRYFRQLSIRHAWLARCRTLGPHHCHRGGIEFAPKRKRYRFEHRIFRKMLSFRNRIFLEGFFLEGNCRAVWFYLFVTVLNFVTWMLLFCYAAVFLLYTFVYLFRWIYTFCSMYRWYFLVDTVYSFIYYCTK